MANLEMITTAYDANYGVLLLDSRRIEATTKNQIVAIIDAARDELIAKCRFSYGKIQVAVGWRGRNFKKIGTRTIRAA